jgi:hypothetical protein
MSKEVVFYHLSRNEQKSSDFLVLSPMGKLPTIVHRRTSHPEGRKHRQGLRQFMSGLSACGGGRPRAGVRTPP